MKNTNPKSFLSQLPNSLSERVHHGCRHEFIWVARNGARNCFELGRGNRELSTSDLQTICNIARNYDCVKYFTMDVMTEVVIPLCVTLDLSQRSVLKLLQAIRAISFFGMYYTSRATGKSFFRKLGMHFKDKVDGRYYRLRLLPEPLALPFKEVLEFCHCFLPVKKAVEMLRDFPFDDIVNPLLDTICSNERGIPYHRSFLRFRALRDGRTISIAEFRDRIGPRRFRPLMVQAYYLAEILEYDDLFRNMLALKCLSKYESTRRIASDTFIRMENATERRIDQNSSLTTTP